jgi:pimeloyl-ACP methyl ester carboxylesterase
MQRRTAAHGVSLLGLRWGATVASLVAEDLPDLRHLILWAPVVDGARYMQEVLRTNITTQMATYKEVRQDRTELVAVMEQGHTVNVDGYEMSLPMYSEVSAVTLSARPKRYSGPCLIAQIDPQPGRPAKEIDQLAATYSKGTRVFAQEEPFWKEIPRWYNHAPNLAAATLEWLRTL